MNRKDTAKEISYWLLSEQHEEKVYGAIVILNVVHHTEPGNGTSHGLGFLKLVNILIDVYG